MTEPKFTGICVAPMHLKGAAAIADAFGVDREKVPEWKRLGAPIVQEVTAGRYDAEYNALQAWRVLRFGGNTNF